MDNNNTKQDVLFYCYTLDAKQREKIDSFLDLLEFSGVYRIVDRECGRGRNGRPEYNPRNMLACVLYGFTTGSSSLRELETSCLYDIRFLYIMEEQKPSYVSFCRFINDVIKPNRVEIFSIVTSAIFRYFGREARECFIDGTKIEADANKYKFVWKPTTFHRKLSDKTRSLLSRMNLSRGVPENGFVSSRTIAEKLSEAKSNESAIADAHGKSVYSAMMNSLSSYLEKTLEYEEKERICGPDRNSYYKTDHDATAMCLKSDYYSGLGSNMHAAYQIQMVMSAGLIASYYLSQSRTDIYDFIPAMENFREMYGYLPEKIGADSGYGCEKNYTYCKRNGVRAFIKYQNWEGESSGRRPALYEIAPDLSLRCLGGRAGFQVGIPERHHKFSGAAFYLVEGCTGCEFMPYCRQTMKEPEGDSRVFEINPRFQLQKQEARDLLLSVEGIEMRVNRSIQSEGGFGVIKQNMSYDRFRRTGMEQVSCEFMLTALGYNIRKFLRFVFKGFKDRYWEAPDGLKDEKFRKPSAKRLAKRANKRRQKMEAN